MPSFRHLVQRPVLAALLFLVLPGSSSAEPEQVQLKDKTLVAWVTLADHQQRGGSVLGIIDPSERFDAIVFGEISPGKWMPGSDMFRRTPHDQSTWTVESASRETRIQLALVHNGNHARLYRDGVLLTALDIREPQTFGDDSAVVIGVRVMSSSAEGEGVGFFRGTVTEARLYDRALDADTIVHLVPGVSAGPAPLGQWVFHDGKAIERTGHFPYVKLHGGAWIDGDRLVLNGEDASLVSRRDVPPPRYDSPIHFRPAVGRLADTIPFFHDGKYHVFYLRAIGKVPWEHIVSTDLVHWTELPTALKADGAPDGPDGQNMFTGCVVERAGLFHIFYVGWNSRNPAGVEFIRHATSPDLLTWTKHPKFLLGPDGVMYPNAHQRDFRDPYVFWNSDDTRYWMVFCSTGKTGVATSPDLEHWTLQPPLDSSYQGMGTPECPDAFRIGDTYYLIMSPIATASTYARFARALRGPYRDPVSPTVDTRILYAAKRMYDGKRHILVGWIRDLAGDRDGGAEQWGGTMCVPRELSAGPEGQLYSRPVPEALAVFQKTRLALTNRPAVTAKGWSYEGSTLVARAANPSPLEFGVPDHYLLQAQLRLDPKAELTVVFRAQSEGISGYRLVVRPGSQDAEIKGPGFTYNRRIRIDGSRPITLTAFVQGSIIECFLNDAYAFSCRAYNFSHGALRIEATDGPLKVLDLSVKTADTPH
jgi:beta-fructofuranosidase